MIDPAHKGLAIAPHTVLVEAGRLKFFAKAVGETNPVYTDPAAAKAAGYRDLPVPPTFLFSLDLEQPDPFGWFNTLGLDLARVLHGTQKFVYHRPACAGDTLTFASKITDIYAKKGGALEFIVKETKVTDASGAPVADLVSTIIQRNG